MKKALLLLTFAVLCLSLSAQQYVVKSSTYDSLNLSFNCPKTLSSSDVVLQGTTYSEVTIDGFDVSSNIGNPALPTLREIIEIPLCSNVAVGIRSAESVLVDGVSIGVNHLVVPKQPSRCKTESRNTNTVVFNQEWYSEDAFADGPIVSVEMLGVARDRNLAQVVFSPVEYNPVTNQFRIYTHVEVVLVYVDVDEAATEHMKEVHYSPAFNSGVHTINKLPSKGVTTAAPMRYLIVANSMFRGKLDAFLAWKKRTGFQVDIVYMDYPEDGTTQASIAAYIKSQYTNATATNPAPTFLLLVGDVAQIPAKKYGSGWTGTHYSDLCYASWTSGDDLPDCYYGRWSAQNEEHLVAMQDKTLMYEQYSFPDPSFLDKAILVAGVDGGSSGDHGYTHADPAMDYAAKFYVNGNYGYADVREYKNNTGVNPNASNVTVSSNSDAVTIRSRYGQGAGWINYSAHGNVDRWEKPQLTNTQVGSMNNTKKFGIMIGNCCLTGKFDESTCFAEALTRRGNYCGAVAYVGGSNSTYWDEDFYWAVGIRSSISGSMPHNYDATHMGVYDRLFHTHDEAFEEWAPTMGSIVMNGNMAVQNSSSSLKAYYWQIYHVFGEPSLMPWLTQAENMPLQVSAVYYGATSVNVTTAPYAYVALTTGSSHDLLGAAFADANGSATIQLNSGITVGTYEVASTAQNHKPGFARVDVYPASISSVDDNSIRMYPNPATSHIFVGGDASMEMTIYSQNGQQILSRHIGAGGEQVAVGSLARGIYYVRLTTQGKSVVKTFVKQ